MTKISFVYFDVGGVLVKDFSETDNWLKLKNMLGITPEKEVGFDQLYDDCEHKMCLGTDDKVFFPKFEEKLGIHFPSGFSFTKYIVDNFHNNPEIYPIVNTVKLRARIGLLTDMYFGMRLYMQEKDLFPDITWDVIIDSSELGLKKPMPEIYALAAERAGVPADEILFIDNRQKNLDGAKLAGWQTYLYDSRDYDQANRDLARFLKL